MNKLLATIVCFGLSALIAGAGGAGKTAPKLEGSWTATGGTSQGKKIPEEVIAKAMMVTTFKDGKYSMTVMGKELEAGSYKVDAKKKPATIDMLASSGDDKGKPQVGILKIEDDNLTIAMAKAGSKDRPKDFAGGAGFEVVTLKRNK